MKNWTRTLVIAVIFSLCFALAACGSASDEKASDETSQQIAETEQNGASIEDERQPGSESGGADIMRYARDNAAAQTQNPQIATRVLDEGTKVNIY